MTAANSGPVPKDGRRWDSSTDIAEAIHSLASVAREGADSLTLAIRDGLSGLNETIRAVGAAIMSGAANQTRVPPASTPRWPDVDVKYAQQNGGRVRPMYEKTEQERTLLERMRSSQKKDRQP